MMAHPLALQLRNLQSLVEIGVDHNTTVVFPAPLMSTIQELGAFLSREHAAGTHPGPSAHHAGHVPIARLSGHLHRVGRRAAGDRGRVQHRLQRSGRRPSSLRADQDVERLGRASGERPGAPRRLAPRGGFGGSSCQPS
jgi:hypothetical protein